jgi:hypothetical protein
MYLRRCPPMADRCPHCSFRPVSRSDFCEKHRDPEAYIMGLVDEYADAFHAAMRPDGSIQFADGIVAKAQKDKVREALRELLF